MNINTNIPAINAHRNLTNIGTRQATASRRLSSGFRINSAADDAAGLAVSEKMRAQIRGLDQSLRNAQDGIALIRTAEGGIASINEMIIRMRELVVQAANDTSFHPGKIIIIDDEEIQHHSNRDMIQWEINQLIEEIDALSKRVQFNTRNLLSGDFAKKPPVEIYRPIILPTSQQLAHSVMATLDPAPVSPFNIPPVPTIIIDSSNFRPNAVCPSGTWSASAGVLTIHNSNEIIEIRDTDLFEYGFEIDRIVVASGAAANIILNNVNINTSTGAALDMREATVNLWLAHGSTSNMETTHKDRAGIETTGGSLTINGTGTLYAYATCTENDGDDSGAGIGGGLNGDSGNITIHGGNITARSRGNGAGIGGGSYGSGGNITITGGNITAVGGDDGAGIGGGSYGNGGNITITGGNISAESSFDGAGIGGGFYGNGGNITITGGIITAYGSAFGAGIGGGEHGDGGDITITGGNITVHNSHSNNFGAGIGGGFLGYGGNIKISGGNIFTESIQGAGIGGGMGGNGGIINISGGIVMATSDSAAAVGGGQDIADWLIPPGLGAILTISGGVLELLHPHDWIGGGDEQDPVSGGRHGMTTYINGNLSFLGNAPKILAGVFNSIGNTLSSYKILLDTNLPPHQPVSFLLYTSGDYRRFDVITDSNGEVFVWLTEPPTDPPIIIAPDNNDNNNNARVPRPTPQTPGDGLWIQTGANANQGLRLYIEATDALTLGLIDVAGNPVISVLHESGVNISPLLQILDDALTHTNIVRANLGAVQNRLEFTSESVLISSENLNEAESRIRNADMAREMMFLSGIKVLQQAAVSMLAQANQLTNSVLQLLQDI
ncbi:MAG: hypothetical protein FWE27_01745 [Defluviitaleaceae bacterium]|nr:hypothetical protein [Defluviitaleaceae bacterium]